MNKKLLAIISLILCFTFVLTACGPKDTEEDPVTPDPLDPIGPVDNFNTGDDIASSAFVGTFTNSYSALFASAASSVFETPEETPSLVCNADGTFSLTVMADMGNRTMRTVTGTFTVNDNTASFTAMDGDKEIQFTMTFASQHELRFAGDQVDCVSTGDIFERVTQDTDDTGDPDSGEE